MVDMLVNVKNVEKYIYMKDKMKKLTELDLLELGFEKVMVSPEESGEEFGYFYFIYGGDGEVTLISCANNECEDEYYIEFFDNPMQGRFYNYDDIWELIKILKCGVKEPTDKEIDEYCQLMLEKFGKDPKFELHQELGRMLLRPIRSFNTKDYKRYNELIHLINGKL